MFHKRLLKSPIGFIINTLDYSLCEYRCLNKNHAVHYTLLAYNRQPLTKHYRQTQIIAMRYHSNRQNGAAYPVFTAAEGVNHYLFLTLITAPT